MTENFSPKDPYEVQAAWETVMTAVKEIREEQKWPDEYIAKTLKVIAESLEETLVAKINKKTVHSRAALLLIKNRLSTKILWTYEMLTPSNICCNRSTN